MKKITSCFLLFVALFLGVDTARAQSCTATFNYTMTANGGVTFSSTSTPANSITTQYYWTFGNSTSYTSTGSPVANTTYTANGTYTVTLFFLTPSTCSNAAFAVITITNVTSSSCSLTANMGWNSTNNGYFQFYSTSTGTTSNSNYLWNYGDNTWSTTASPGWHQYSSNGNYTVTLLVNNNSNPACVDSITSVITVTNVCNLNANFSYSVSGSNVYITNLTTPSISTTYSWNTSDWQNSTNTNPVFTFSANGVYTITLFANTFNPNCFSSMSQTVLITNSSTCNINANFGYTQGSNGLVNFNNTSTGTNGGTTYSWSFGDSNSSTSTSPAHTYASNGSYIVTLTASNGGTCTSTKTLTVNVNSYCTLSASFGYTLGSNGQVNFANTSTGTQSGYIYFWTFGDQSSGFGTTPNHTYANGTYVVVLTVSNSSISPTCTSSATQTITVTSNTCVANAGFSVVPTSTAQYWNAYPLSGSNVSSAVWSWGDGNYSNTLYTSHQYSSAGTYDLCLSVTVSCGATDTYCAPYSIYRTSGNNDVIYVNVIDGESVGLNEQSASTKMSVYPNPTKGAFVVQFSQKAQGTSKAIIYNIAGSKVQENVVPEGATEISVDASALPSGIYLLKLETQNKGTVVQKIVIDR